MDSLLSGLLRPELSELRPYSPHPGSFPIRLDANEAAPFLPATARARCAEVVGQIAWERYPDVAVADLRAALAARCGVTPEEILVGVGSDEIIAMLLTALSRPRQGSDSAIVLTVTPTFVMYRSSARVRGLRTLEVPLDDAWDLSEHAIAAALRVAEPNVIFVASPNNPTGSRMSYERLSALATLASTSLVVIDEAYIDYSDRNHLDLYREHANVCILRTLSKIGFAALRVGWLIARPELVGELDKIRLPYNMSTLSQRLGLLAVTELGPDIATGVRTIVSERERVTRELANLPGVRVTPSQANFLWIQSDTPAERVFHALGQRGILVRSFHDRGGRLTRAVRVTIGTAAENDAFLQAYRAILSDA